ncbi:hypothetical protein HBH98_235980 [Parastagonospora nodorum]|nr:hypothetical protein HBI10_237670 [Parastagonospora nodorum]KAH4008445.1 hypothetical protein HBI13_236180 [Parastagonospora nodorum]KAH4011304.1 hypothetical protein HBI09_227720 [Parastagonospora nodorum]KAH4112200.1 hypothetical protein HBH47_229150 [Parastagonospora nodorum]KAH4155887.1 hypothetical protein HBH43_209540 [Parastagonospora nodorum]
MWFVNSEKVEEVWPLKPRDSVDLGWLKLCDGKRVLWEIADPKRPDSIFHNVLKEQNAYTVILPEWVRDPDAMARIPPRLKRIFGVTSTSTIDNNVYLLTLTLLSRLQNQRLTIATSQSFLQAIAFVTPELVRLLESKDPRAVFIIGWWFKMMADGDLWWVVPRAKIEGRTIRIWLEKEDGVFGLAQVLDDLVPERSMPQEQPGISRIDCYRLHRIHRWEAIAHGRHGVLFQNCT